MVSVQAQSSIRDLAHMAAIARAYVLGNNDALESEHLAFIVSRVAEMAEELNAGYLAGYSRRASDNS